jgi:hypothetical protein
MNIDVEQADLLAQLSLEADEKLEASEPESWGEAIDLAEGEKFIGRYRGEAISPVTNREVYLLAAPAAGEKDVAKASVPVFIRGRTMLVSEMERVRPEPGDFIVIARGDDRAGKVNDYHWYAVAVAPCPEPLPETVSMQSDEFGF